MAHEHSHSFGVASAEMFDLDAEVLHDYHSTLMDWLSGLAPETRRILDIGAGSGTGTLGLARRFPQASVVALDASADLLAYLTHRAHAAGLGDRVQPLLADLDAGWPDLEPVDLAWASASLHHMAEPDRVLADIRGALRPGGLFAVVELTGFPRFLPGADPIEERLHAELSQHHAAELPHMGDDWGDRLAKAGFTVAETRHFDIHLSGPELPAATGRYAQVSLQRLAERYADRLPGADRATLDRLLGEDIRTRRDLEVRARRSVWIGRA
ncbi:trans-aconitate 2-methyltransferase [Actinoplanes sp. N902-109]|uniref:class I SAM-dependent methyltransferase n=1 Tax=Actinoplanes sp. (strain N902-109) TaxID=649831 RepID=UPI0003293C9D|nr:class I SAM-dependent methyltransferase [Actinoplanes sp. N902-109]AGL17585.1 methyltransferase [Actinoplanes sp. N902-109]